MNHVFNTFFSLLPRRIHNDDDDNDFEESIISDDDVSRESLSDEEVFNNTLQSVDAKLYNRVTSNCSTVTTNSTKTSTSTTTQIIATAETKQKETAKETEQAREDADYLPLPCIICESSLRTILFLPCKHCTACVGCAAQVNKCPICRKLIVEKISIIFS